PAEARADDLRQRPERRGIDDVVADDADAAAALGDEHAAVGWKRDAPRAIESFDRRHVDADAATCREIPWPRAERVDWWRRRPPPASAAPGGLPALLCRSNHAPERDDRRQANRELLQRLISCCGTPRCYGDPARRPAATSCRAGRAEYTPPS